MVVAGIAALTTIGYVAFQGVKSGGQAVANNRDLQQLNDALELYRWENGSSAISVLTGANDVTQNAAVLAAIQASTNSPIRNLTFSPASVASSGTGKNFRFTAYNSGSAVASPISNPSTPTGSGGGTPAAGDESVLNPIDVTALAGGSTSLNGLSTAALPVGRKVMIGVGGSQYLYELVSGTDVQSLPDVVRPLDYSESNARIWRLRRLTDSLQASQSLADVANPTQAYANLGGGTLGRQNANAATITGGTAVLDQNGLRVGDQLQATGDGVLFAGRLDGTLTSGLKIQALNSLVGSGLTWTGAGHDFTWLATGANAPTGAGSFALYDNTAGAFRIVVTGTGEVAFGGLTSTTAQMAVRVRSGLEALRFETPTGELLFGVNESGRTIASGMRVTGLLNVGMLGTDASGNLIDGGSVNFDARYVQKTGDTMGPLTVNGALNVNGTLGATNFSGTHSGTSSGVNTGDQTTISGNAGSATVLQTARLINGISFNGSANVTVPAAAGTLTGTALPATVTTSSLTRLGLLGSSVLGTDASGNLVSANSANLISVLGYTPYNSTNPSGYITGITSANVTGALGYTPYNATNPSGYITGITSGNVTTALGYTPYNATNPSGYITSAGSISGNAATATSSPLLSALGAYVWSASSAPTTYNMGVQTSFVQSANGFPSYGSLINVRTYSGPGGDLQMYVPYSPTYGGTGLQVRFGNYDAGNVWTSWKTLLASDNFNSYAPSLTGSGASGTWGINVTGNAATASSVAWSGVTGKPTTLSGFGITNSVTQMDGSRDNTNYNSRLTSGFYNAADAAPNKPGQPYAQLITVRGVDTGWQLAGGYTNNTIYTRGWHSSGTFLPWNTLLSDGNFNSYAPSLTGSGASGTWGINITGNAATITSQANSATITASNGIHGNQIVQRDDNGYIRANYINFNTGIENPSIDNFITGNGDGWSRKSSLAHVKNSIRGVADGTWGINVTGSAGTAGSIAGFNNPTTAANANTIVYRDGGGHISGVYGFFNYLNMSHGASGATGDTVFYSSRDDYIRKNNGTGFRASLNVPTRTGGDASGTWSINVTGSAGSAGSANSVPASGISGQAGMWTSAARPGPYRLYRNDDNSPYNVQTYWTGARWRLRGYYADSYHAEAEVAYADSSGYAGSSGSISGYNNPTTSSAANTIVYRDGSGGMQAVSVRATSTGRWKENVRPISGAMAIIERLDGVYYDGRAGTVLAGQKHEPGFIAEQVAAVVPEIVGRDQEGNVDSVDYSRVAPILVEGLKETARTVRETRPEIDAMRAEIRSLQKQMAEVRPAAGAAGGISPERWWELMIVFCVGLSAGALLIAKSRPRI